MRSKLFVPASRPELYAKALAGPADALSFDLEDSVAAERKDAARQELGAWLAAPPAAQSGKTLIVRVNGLDTPHFGADVQAVAREGLDMLNLPKAEEVEQVREAASALARAEAANGV
ncbi:aldolase/citrate lyase family protein, partial [Bordetella petrii]|uniref:aldolase/citrate lyase family protein n=1 Tax=Bordetella petrii TaxID=94624 RepID=UPI001E3ECCBF